MSWIIQILLVVSGGLGSALLPSPERERFARERGYDPPRWSFAIGLLELVLGTGLFVYGGLAFLMVATGEQGMLLLENWWPGMSTNDFRGLGILNWIAWFFNPLSWPFAYLALVGLTRCVAFGITREAVGEPLVWAALRLRQSVKRRRDRRKLEERLGPLRRDRIVTDREFDLVVLSCREKPGWTETVTIEIDERYYRVAGVEMREDGAWQVVAYLLRECHPGSVIRRLVQYGAANQASR